jgi:TRAP-type C4-dicarboxylate transport system permease small subunit
VSGPLARTLARVSDVLRRLEDAALVLLLSAMILIGGAQIVMRNLLGQALSGADESQRLIVLWLAVLGAVAASRDRKQLRIDLVSRYLKGRVRLALEAFADLLTAAVAGVIAWYALAFVRDSLEFGDQLVGGVSAGLVQAVIPVGFALIALRHLVDGLLALAGRRREPAPALLKDVDAEAGP